ncbi:MAG: YybH family protein [Candidatus Glassbacteria bacterium]
MGRSVLILMVVVVCGCFVAAVSPLSAGEWNSEQQEVWKTVETYTEIAAKGDVEGFLKYFHEDYTGWSYDSPIPYGISSVKKWVSYFLPNREMLVYEITPVAIKVHGDFAFVHYYYSQAYKDIEGKMKYANGRWTDILAKKDGKWMMIGDHGGETSSE